MVKFMNSFHRVVYSRFLRLIRILLSDNWNERESVTFCSLVNSPILVIVIVVVGLCTKIDEISTEKSELRCD